MENKVQLFNTLTRKIEQFVPNTDGKVSMYTCGPTVYHFAHIGNLRSYIMEDVLEKTLRYEGYDVKRVMNITDVGHLTSDADTGEDKMLKGAKREHKTVMEIAKYYTDAFFSDCAKLNIKTPDVVEPATNCIPEFIHMIEVLLEKGYAYIAGGNVYFDTSKLDDYYVFSSQSEKELMVGVRDDVSEDTNKRNKADFVLWFTKSKFDNQELKWDSPWGVGYPGWHIECSCISMKHLGEYMDIHCGGVDNIFPHHTNEIAQSESYLGHKWCNYWFHVHHLNDRNGKMSKSNGEFLTVSVLEEKGYDPLVYRLFCLQSHYRKPLEFTYEIMDNTKAAYNKLVKRNIFPHHTNEIAQSESYLGHKWCNYWFHVHHLNDRNGKMSKSNGEFLTVSVLEEKGYDPLVYRLFCLQSHYRKPLEFTYEIMDNTKAAYNKLVKRIGELKEDGEVDKAGFDKYKTDFKAALENDINTASAITVVYDVLRSDLNDATKLALVKDFDYVLSLNLTRMQGENAAPKADDELTAFVEAKIEERKAAKKEKDFAKADAIRDELLAKGVRIKDTREGVVWELV